ncbi:MAG: iron-sulfur cluster insertion protein ErpA [Actinomycetota bacterium]
MARRSLEIKEREQIFSLTTAAARKVRELLTQEGTPDAALRLEVQPGGCAGFRYGLFFDDELVDSDIVEDIEGVKVVCDPMSAPYLKGVVVDWAETLERSGFIIENPNAQSSCACGDSFQ